MLSTEDLIPRREVRLTRLEMDPMEHRELLERMFLDYLGEPITLILRHGGEIFTGRLVDCDPERGVMILATAVPRREWRAC